MPVPHQHPPVQVVDTDAASIAATVGPGTEISFVASGCASVIFAPASLAFRAFSNSSASRCSRTTSATVAAYQGSAVGSGFAAGCRPAEQPVSSKTVTRKVRIMLIK